MKNKLFKTGFIVLAITFIITLFIGISNFQTLFAMDEIKTYQIILEIFILIIFYIIYYLAIKNLFRKSKFKNKFLKIFNFKIISALIVLVFTICLGTDLYNFIRFYLSEYTIISGSPCYMYILIFVECMIYLITPLFIIDNLVNIHKNKEVSNKEVLLLYLTVLFVIIGNISCIVYGNIIPSVFVEYETYDNLLYIDFFEYIVYFLMNLYIFLCNKDSLKTKKKVK